MLNARYRRRGVDEELNVAIRPGRRKKLPPTGKGIQTSGRPSRSLPLVLLSPADMTLCCGEPAERRRFIDQIASQSDPRYLEAMIRYTQATDGRNRLLRAESCDNSPIRAFEMQMDAAAHTSAVYARENSRRTRRTLPPLYPRHSARRIAGAGLRARNGSQCRNPGCTCRRTRRKTAPRHRHRTHRQRPPPRRLPP